MIINKITAKVLVLMFSLFWTATSSAQTAVSPSVAVKLSPVKEKLVGETLVSYGVLDPDPDQLLSFSLSRPGLINRVWVRRGQRIKRGDKLLEIVTLPEAHMQFLKAQTGVDFAERELKRKKRMMADQLVTKADVDSANKMLRDAKSTLEAMRQRGMGRPREILFAPMDGIITRLDISQGKRVPANSTAMLIATEKRLIARLGIEPEDLNKIKPDYPVTLTSVFVPEIKVNSKIRDIHAMINPDTHLVEILVPIPVKDVDHLILGSRVIGRISLPRHIALIVPRTAVLTDAQGQKFLFGVQSGKARYISVTPGVEDGDFIEVSGDIKKGDRVVISGNYELKDGMMVREAP